VQAMAHLELSWEQMNIDMLSFGAHKFYGPKGVGGLIVRKGLKLLPQNTGGSQEEGLRAGTQNVPLIMGMTKAYELITINREERNRRLTYLRNMIIEEILHTIQGAYLTGHPEKRLPNHASFVFEGISGQDLVVGLDMAGFAVSSGSACKVGNPKPSEVLLAIGIPENLAKGALRVTVGKHTTENEITLFISALKKLVNELRKKD
jgi:cysteine desulfurase